MDLCGVEFVHNNTCTDASTLTNDHVTIDRYVSIEKLSCLGSSGLMIYHFVAQVLDWHWHPTQLGISRLCIFC